MLRDLLPSLLFASGVISFALIVWWSIQNDAAGNSGGERGLFAMRSSDKKDPNADKGWRRKGS